MAAEALGIASAVTSLLTTTTRAILLVQALENAPEDARRVQAQLQTASAILHSLQLSLATASIPLEFERFWNSALRLVIDNMQSTLEDLSRNLGDETTDWRLRRRVRWVFNRARSSELQQLVQSYTAMLSSAQSALLQANINEIQCFIVRVVDDIGGDTTYPLSANARERVDLDALSTVISVSTGTTPNPSIATGSTARPRATPNTQTQSNESRRRTSTARSHKVFGSWDVTNVWKIEDIKRLDLGKGKISVICDQTADIWITFAPLMVPHCVSSWNFSTESIITVYGISERQRSYVLSNVRNRENRGKRIQLELSFADGKIGFEAYKVIEAGIQTLNAMRNASATA